MAPVRTVERLFAQTIKDPPHVIAERMRSGPVLLGDARDPLIGRVVGKRYVIEGLLGAGSMGRVYRARQRVLGKTVALKVLNADVASDLASGQRFLREAKAASRFDHPNSVAVFDFGREADGTAFIVMEYVRGETLGGLIRRLGTVPAADCVAIMAQVLSALSAAHERGIVHRDLKPENIMLLPRVSDDGGGYTVKVADFGLAKIVDDESLKLTAPGISPGSPAYMSPEQAQAKGVGASSDLYQCGVMLFEMITGALPFRSDSAVGVIMMHLHDEVPSPSSRNPACPPELERVILHAMAKDHARRYSTARAMRHALLGRSQRPPTEEFFRSHPRPATLAASFPWRVEPASAPETVASGERAVARVRSPAWGALAAAAACLLAFGIALRPSAPASARPTAAAPVAEAPPLMTEMVFEADSPEVMLPPPPPPRPAVRRAVVRPALVRPVLRPVAAAAPRPAAPGTVRPPQ